MKLFIKLFRHFAFGFMPLYAISANDAAAYIIQFKDAVKELAGGPMRSYLKEMIGYEKCEGESALIGGGFQPNLSAGRRTALASVTNRYTYDQLASTDASVLAAHLLTPNDTGTFQRTQVLPQQIDIGCWKEQAEKSFLALPDPTSRELRNLMQGYWTKEDLSVMDALFAATTTRVTGTAATPTTTASVSMPATQVMDDFSLATIDYKVFSAVKKRFLKQYQSGADIFAVFGPDTWEALVNNSGDRLLNQDYVDSASYFMDGKLPKCMGVVPVVHPLFENSTLLGDLLGAGEQGLIGAFTEDGLTWAEFMSMTSLMAIDSPEFKGQSVALVKEFANACRNDDNLVVNGAVVA